MNRGELEKDQETLRRIAAKLLGLAVLAERVSVLPCVVRALVLWLLRPAEAVAREFVVEEAGGALALPAAAIFGTDGDSRAAALRLAYCFRLLASLVNGLQAHAECDQPRPVPERLIGRSAYLASRMTPWDRAMKAPGAMVLCCAVGRIDTS